MWKFSGLFRCENFQAYLGVKISGLKFSGVKFFNPPYLAQFQPNLHVKILAWSHVKISGLKQVWFTCENRCDRFGTGCHISSGKYLASNYRPVSLICICCKLLEHIVVSKILNHLDLHNILVDCQHGFRAKRICETQLLSLSLSHELLDNLHTGT